MCQVPSHVRLSGFELSKSDKFTAAFPDDAQGQADQEQDPQKFAKLELERIKGKTKT